VHPHLLTSLPLVAATHTHTTPLTWVQAIVMGLLQGIAEMFPVSSLGHTVLVPAWLGWHNLVNSESKSESFYLAFVVGLHVATAFALLVYFWRDWVRIIGGLCTSIRNRRIETPTQRLAWLLVVATIPAGIVGLAFEQVLRTQFAKPLSAAIFLTLNGGILYIGERLRKRDAIRTLAVRHGEVTGNAPSDEPVARSVRAGGIDPAGGGPRRRLDTLEMKEAGIIGLFQVLPLIAGISRSGVTMVAGLLRGLDHEDAARFSFLLATPVILAAGVLKVPDLTGHLGNGVRGQILLGCACAAVSAYFAVKFLLRYFETRTLTPFAIYCLIAGVISIVRFA
jgi:undecaprenyl-diphosphatase